MHPTFEGSDGGSRGDSNACWETGQGDSSTTGEREVAGYVPMRWSLRMAGVEEEGDGGCIPLVPWVVEVEVEEADESDESRRASITSFYN
jgi:hypothetical protein